MRTLIAPSLLLVAAACGGSKPAPATATGTAPPATAEAPAATGPGAPTSGAPAAETAPAHKLFVAAAACWFGGVWSEAEGADTAETRKAASEARCHDLNKRVYGADEKERYEQLRALDANVVDDVKKKVEDLAAKGEDAAHKDALVKLTGALADAKKEEMLARRAGDRVKRDFAKEPEKLSADEAAAVAPLKASTALETLLKLDAGDLSTEAHALAVMSAMERAAIAKGLPKHLKVYAVSAPFQLLFSVKAPQVPEDATKPLKPGTWLAYLIEAAKGAGHPVPATAKTPLEKEPAAWAGVLEGLHDKLRPDVEKMTETTPLKEVATVVARRLQSEYDRERDTLRKNAAGAGATPAPKPTGPTPTPKKP
jgi:hypothetical protein